MSENVEPKQKRVLKSRTFLLDKRTEKFREIDKEKVRELLKSESLNEGDLIVRAGRVSEIRKSTKLSLQKQE